MAESFGSHNKTSLPYDPSSVSNCFFCLPFLPVLDFPWPSVPVSNTWHRFLLSYPPSGSFFSFRCLSEVPLDPQRISSARAVTMHSRLAGAATAFLTSVASVYMDFLTDPYWPLKYQNAGFLLGRSFTCCELSKAKAGMLCIGYT